MPRFFNTAGPSVPEDHFMIDPLERLHLSEVAALIEQKRYFVLHAPRQTGKTTSLLALMAHLNKAGQYRALYVNVEVAQTAREDVKEGMHAIIGSLASSARLYLQDDWIESQFQKILSLRSPHEALLEVLKRWSASSKRPIVLLMDEVDALVGDTLISLLRQIRSGYAQRPLNFPQSIILCGVRDIRDYRIHTRHHEIITGGSAFNIKTKSIRIGNFNRTEVGDLFQQHTEETGQAFAPEIFPELWEDTQGQPWLVNALGYELTWEDRAARDRRRPITIAHYFAGRERLIQSRATHLDQLSDKLREDRVRPIIAGILSGDAVAEQFPTDDIQYVEDLGLITTKPQISISNRIYLEVIPRELTWNVQTVLTDQQFWYVTDDHRLDICKLLAAFQQFFREHSDAWLEKFDYKEAGPQLLMQAFLQRIINGGGRVNREYGLGRKRTDLLVEWPLNATEGFFGPLQRVVIELKILRKGIDRTISEGLAQTADYADRCKADAAHLIIFNRDPTLSWEAKIWRKKQLHAGRSIEIWGV